MNEKKLTDIGTVKEILARHGFRFSKSLGQNFLVNPSVCPKIAEEGAVAGEGVIEIGPGLGTLTAELAKRAKKVVAVEIDGRLLPVLGETLDGLNNVKIIQDDILKVDLPRLIAGEFSGAEKISVCANLPYYITSPVIMRVLESGAAVESMTVMVQKEFARRICAPVGSGEAGAITAAVNYYGTPELLFNVSAGSFMPAPKVDSAVVKITLGRRLGLSPGEETIFFKVVKAGFAQRRKTMTNALFSGLQIPKERTAEILAEIGLNENIRFERLKLEEIAEFTRKINT